MISGASAIGSADRWHLSAASVLYGSRIGIGCDDESRGFDLVMRGTSGFFRLVSDLPEAATLSANRNSGMYFYLSGRLVGRTRRPGQMNRVWLGSATHHYNLDAPDGRAIEIVRGKSVVAGGQEQGGTLTMWCDPNEPETLILLWVVAALRLAAPPRDMRTGADPIDHAIAGLKRPSPWLSLASNRN